LETKEKWVWKGCESVEFFVKSAYSLLRGEEAEDCPKMYNFFLRIKALPSAHVTTWRVIENKIATKVNLERRGVQVKSNLCCLCRVLEESTSHLFFGCRVTWLAWNLCYVWLGVSSINILSPGSHIEQFKILDATTSVNLILGNVWIALVSEIWRHINIFLFNKGVVDYFEVFCLAHVKVWSWISSKVPSTSFLFFD